MPATHALSQSRTRRPEYRQSSFSGVALLMSTEALVIASPLECVNGGKRDGHGRQGAGMPAPLLIGCGR